MTEPIKQEIISCIYENGENLITGPVLQEVLLDMVDDTNAKIASGSVPGDLVEKTGSWDDAADWVEQNSSSVVLQPDLDGYATEQWVEDQGYLKEVPEGYATTESLNDLSESVAQSIADIPEPDLSNYATKPELNEATESVKEWVENKHYLTTASLSGSVTEESVQFMINDATSSVKDWVGDQNYATETFVSQAIAEIPGTDLTGYATEQWVEEQGYLKEHQDISGLATTESVNSLSESVAQDFANLNIPDVSGLATTASVNQLSESIAQTIEDLPEVDLSGYVTTASYNTDSASFDQRINAITGSDLSGYATTSSVNALSESVYSDSASFDQRINGINIPDVSIYATTASLNSVSESISQSIDALAGNVADKAEARDLTSLSESVAADILNARTEASAGFASVNQGIEVLSASFDQRISEITGSDLSGYLQTSSYLVDSASFDSRINNALQTAEQAIGDLGVNLNSLSSSVAEDFANLDIPDVSGYATTQSVNNLSASFAETIDNIPGTDLTGYATEQWVQDQGYLTEHQDISGLATTSSVSALSSSVSSDIQSAREEASQAITGLGTIVQGESDRVTGLSASFDDRINNITGSDVDLSGYATTSSVNQLSSSVATDIQNAREEAAAGFASVNQGVVALSASFDQRINDISGSEVDLSGYATTASLNSVSQSLSASIAAGGVTLEQLQDLGLVYNNDGYWVAADDQEHGGLPLDGEGSFWTSAPAFWRNLVSWDLIGYDEYDEEGTTHWSVGGAISTAEWPDNPVGVLLRYISDGKLVAWSSEKDRWDSPIVGEVGGKLNTSSFNTVSASFDQRINSITASGGSGVDTDLRNFLFGVESQTLTGITGSCTNIYSVVSSDTTLGFSAVPDNGTSLGIIIKNEGSSNATITLPDTVTVGSTIYNLITNGVDNSGSMSISSGEYGDIVVTRQGTDLFVRTSIDLKDIDIDLSGYATTESVNTLSASFAETIDNLPSDTETSLWKRGAAPYSLEQIVDSSLGLNSATDTGSLAQGDSTTASGQISHAEGYGTVASGLGSHAEGTGTKTIGSYSHAEGRHTTASGVYSHAEGNGTVAQGGGSHAEGINTTASADYSHAEGTGTKAIGRESHAEGAGTVASGQNSHAEGYHSVASSMDSHAEGCSATASGDCSHAEGYHTVTTNAYEHAQGQYNATASSQIFSAGVGDVNARRNAISIITGSGTVSSASIYLYGIGSYDGTNPQPGVNDVATVISNLVARIEALEGSN